MVESFHSGTTIGDDKTTQGWSIERLQEEIKEKGLKAQQLELQLSAQTNEVSHLKGACHQHLQFFKELRFNERVLMGRTISSR